MAAIGGNGGTSQNPGGGSGGGLGAGGGLFIDSADVILLNVTFTNCGAAGGTGSSSVGTLLIGSSGGGGGMGGSGGTGDPFAGEGGGGGGGLGGNGGNSGGGAGNGGSGSGGGGAGPNTSGGAGFWGGGGGGGATGTGGDGGKPTPGGSGTGTAGKPGTGTTYGGGGGGGGGSDTFTGYVGGNGAGPGQGGGSPSGTSGGGGGGGGGTGSTAGGAGSTNGGVGGLGGIGGGGGGGGSSEDGIGAFGGAGGNGGGGGGGGNGLMAGLSSGEIGGYGGGGGGGGVSISPGLGASGGFGGGAGGSPFDGNGVSSAFGGGGSGGGGSGNAGGAGGFGAGGGGGGSTSTGGTSVGGFGGAGGNGAGGNGGSGGGGAGLGGAIFVNTGTLTIQGGVSTSNSSVVAGTGANSGAAEGNDIFLISPNTLTFSPAASMTTTIQKDIIESAPGVSVIMNGAGTLSFTGTAFPSNYSGGTTISNGGTVSISSMGNLGTGTITFDIGTLEATNSFTLPNAISITAATSAGIETINGADLNLSGMITGGASSNLAIDGGTVTLSGTNNNTQAWTTSLNNSSTLILGAADNIGTGEITFNGTNILETTNTFTLPNNIAISASSTAIIEPLSGVDLTLMGNITSGSEATLFLEGGKLILGGTNDTQTWELFLNTGVFVINTETNISTGPIAMNTGTVFIATSNTTLSNEIFILDGANADFIIGPSNPNVLTFLNPIQGSASSPAIVFEGNVELSSTTASTYGGATIVAGTLLAGAMNTFSPTSEFVISPGGLLDLNNFSNTIGSLSGDGVVILGTTAILTTGGNNGTTTYDGTISGTGTSGLTKVGNGTFTLTADNMYPGPTTLQSGAMILTGSVAGDLIVNSGFMDVEGAVGGNLTVNDGLTEIEGTVAGNLIVNSGLTDLNGFVAGSLMLNGGLFEGSGIIDGNATISGGILSPGSPSNLTGPLNINGNLMFGAGATTSIQLTPTQSAEILINGASSMITLAGTLFAVPNPGKYTTGTVYTILDATGAGSMMSGMFNFVPPPGFANMQILYGHNFVELIVGTDVPHIPTCGESGNNLALIDYLNSLSYGTVGSPYQPLQFFPCGTLTAALKTISPSRNSTLTFVSQNMDFTFAGLVSSHLFRNRNFRNWERSSSPQEPLTAFLGLLNKPRQVEPVETSDAESSVIPCQRFKPCRTHSIWLDGFGEYASQAAQHEIPSFRFRSGGAILGLDYGTGEYGLVGAAAGYARSSIRQNENFGQGLIDFYLADLYASYYYSNYFVDLSVLGGYNHFKSERHVFFPGFSAQAKASSHAWQVTPLLDFGYDWTFWCNYTLEPFAMFDWAVNFNSELNESGAGAFDMHQKSQTSSMLRSEVGVNGYENFYSDNGFFIFREKLSYVNKAPFHTGRITANVVGAPGSFAVESFTSTQNLFSWTLEGYCQKKNGSYFSLSYDGEWGSGYFLQLGTVEVGRYF